MAKTILNEDEEIENEEVVDNQEKDNAEFCDYEKQITELKEKNLRLMAEFENYKKRTQKEKEAAYDYAAANTVALILPVLDNLELSLKQPVTDVDSFKKGVEMVTKQLVDILSKIGITEIENQTFDPEFHNAVMRDEESDAESGTIVEIFQKGYKLNDRVVRHSMVKVKG